MALASLALLLEGISAWLETPNLCWVSSLLPVGAALRTEGLSVGHPVEADMLGVHVLPGRDGDAGETQPLAGAGAEEK